MLIAPAALKGLGSPKFSAAAALRESFSAQAAAAGHDPKSLKSTTAFALRTLAQPSAIEEFMGAFTPVADSSFLTQVRGSASLKPNDRLSLDDLIAGVTLTQPGTKESWLGSLKRATEVEAARVAAERARPARTGQAIEQSLVKELTVQGVPVDSSSILQQALASLRHTGEIAEFTRYSVTKGTRGVDIAIGALNSAAVGTSTAWLDAERDLPKARGGWGPPSNQG